MSAGISSLEGFSINDHLNTPGHGPHTSQAPIWGLIFPFFISSRFFPQGQALYFLYFRTPGIEGKLSTYLSTDCLNCLIAETYKLLIEMLPQDPTATSVLFDSVFATTSRWPGLLCWRSRFLPLGMRAESHPSRMGSVLCCYPLRT